MARTTQPYRKGSAIRNPGPALQAMLRGRSLHGTNPADQRRALMLKKAKRKTRPSRPARPPR